MKQLVLPIKDSNVLHEVQDTLLNNFRFGRRNYTIFQFGKATLLRVSDVLALRRNEIFTDDGLIKKNAYIRDKKTNKPNTLYLKPIKQDLSQYYSWLDENSIHLNGFSLQSNIMNDILPKSNSIRLWPRLVIY